MLFPYNIIDFYSGCIVLFFSLIILGTFYIFIINSLANVYVLDLLFLIYINGKKLERKLIFLLKIITKYYYP
jgi:hypothetical protein